MRYMLLYLMHSDSLCSPYVCSGAHPPPRRLRSRVPAKMTHKPVHGVSRAIVHGLLGFVTRNVDNDRMAKCQSCCAKCIDQ